jgi:hypothetical protein
MVLRSLRLGVVPTHDKEAVPHLEAWEQAGPVDRDGYMLEYPVAKAFLDSRVQTTYGGTTEIMKEIIGRSLGV